MMTYDISRITETELVSAACDNDADAACRRLQEIAGIPDGGLCSQFIDQTDWAEWSYDERRSMLSQWLEAEETWG